jgi:hypothetical protein
MARLSLQHNALAEDFYIERNANGPVIHVREGTEYPLDYFNRDDNRRFLSWVLMDTYARKSFESISANLLTNQNRRGNFDFWDFQFSPPPLTNVKIKVSGWEDSESQSFFVWEIHSLIGLSSSVTGEVDIIHPKYDRKVGGKPTRGDNSKGTAPEYYELDDEQLSDTDKATVHLMSETVKVSFKDPFITNRISKNSKSVNNTIGEGNGNVPGIDLSANEKEETGSLPGGAWNNLQDETDDSLLYLSKFKSFLEMINRLESSHNCRITGKVTMKLPQLGDGKKHWLTDTQNPRCLVIVELVYENQLLTLLEIDTSDGAARLSTMMLRTGLSGWLTENLDRIKIGIMKKSLGWPTPIFEEYLATDEYSGIPHPKSKHPGMLEPHEIAPWAQRFANWIRR